jgi:hypothetical protein
MARGTKKKIEQKKVRRNRPLVLYSGASRRRVWGVNFSLFRFAETLSQSTESEGINVASANFSRGAKCQREAGVPRINCQPRLRARRSATRPAKFWDGISARTPNGTRRICVPPVSVELKLMARDGLWGDLSNTTLDWFRYSRLREFIDGNGRPNGLLKVALWQPQSGNSQKATEGENLKRRESQKCAGQFRADRRELEQHGWPGL